MLGNILLAMIMEAASATAARLPAATPVSSARASHIPPDQRRAFFGELHLHTVMSLDAWTYGTQITPDQAYKFGRGETITVPAAQLAREQGISSGQMPARRAWALDFMAVTDHSEYMGAMHQLDDPNSAFSQSALGRFIRDQPDSLKPDFKRQLKRKGISKPALPAQVAGSARQSLKDAAAASDAWAVMTKAANDNYEPGRFTTLLAYEWSAKGDRNATLHRNVFFNSDHAPAPFTSLDSKRPEDLWKYLEAVRAQGIDAIAIPHNSNHSLGLDFDWNMSNGQLIDRAYALERALNEPLVEISQSKGTSETTPQLSPTDEFADFALDTITGRGKYIHGSYVREAFGRGLIIQSRVGANPFKYGVAGASDLHNGLSTSDETAYAGGGPYGIDPNTMLPSRERAQDALARGASKSQLKDNDDDSGKHKPVQYKGGSITGVWAEENTRDSIFAALRRKETFATSGTRIRLRMFGGWHFDPAMIQHAGWVTEAYADGVPMGADLPAAPPSTPGSASAPTFVVQAMKDPDGANLDRIQIIKVWLEGGDYKERLFDVALSDNRKPSASGHASSVGNTVDLKTGTYRNSIGAATLTAVWKDPQFDPKTPAVYYARALEIPTPRWSTLLAIKERLPIPPASVVPPSIQQRAWSSPIWFTPGSSRATDRAASRFPSS